MIEPRKVYIQPFYVSGLSVRTINREEFDPSTAKLPTLWQQFSTTGLVGALSDSPIYGVYSDYETDDTGHYTVTAGIDTSMQTPPKFTIVKVEGGDYLVFEDQGPMPQTVIDTWKRVWRYFAKETTHRRSFTTDFELYRGADSIAVYIKLG